MSPRPLAKPDFERLVREHHAAVYRSAWRLLRSHDDALDVAQKVFLLALEGKIDMAAANDVRALLSWTAVKNAMTLLRGRERARLRENDHAMNRRTVESADQAGREDLDLLERSLDNLPEDLRVAIQLRFRESLTFGAMARILGCSEPTAHDRVKRGLEKLRFDFGRAAFGVAAAAGVDLERLLAVETAPPCPPAVESALLSLKAAPAGLAALKASIMAALLVGAVGVGSWKLVFDDQEQSGDRRLADRAALGAAREGGAADDAGVRRTGRAAAANPIAATVELSRFATETGEAMAKMTPVLGQDGPTGALVGSDDPAADEAVVIGRIVDEGGAPIERALVTVLSRESKGKAPRFSAQGRSGADGGFDLKAPVPEEEGRDYTLDARSEEYVIHRSQPFLLKKGERKDLGAITLKKKAVDRPGKWSIEISVLDHHGRAAAKVAVGLHRPVLTEAGYWGRDWQVGGLTDAAGKVRFEGDFLGEKVLVVDGHQVGLPAVEERIAVEQGANAWTVALPEGFSIGGRVVLPDGGDPWKADVDVFAIGRNQNDWIAAKKSAGGEFLVEGLENRAYTLYVQTWTYSRGHLEDVAIDRRDVELRLKARTDPTDRGLHDGEIHGTTRDAKSGNEVVIGEFDVDLDWIVVDGSEDVENDLLPNHVAVAPKQRASFGKVYEGPDFHEIGLRPGTYMLKVHPKDYAAFVYGPIKIEKKTFVKDIDVRLHRPSTLKGKVVDSGGKPIAGASVFITGDGPLSRKAIAVAEAAAKSPQQEVQRGTTRAEWGAVTTDAEGRFALTHVPPNMRLRLAAVHKDYATTTSDRLALEAGQATDIELKLAPR